MKLLAFILAVFYSLTTHAYAQQNLPINSVPYSRGPGIPTWAGTTPTPNGVLVTSGANVPSISTTLPPVTLTTPNIGVATATSLAIGGATLGSNALAVTGHLLFEGVTSTGATGSGNLVFATSPTLIAPSLGSATATSLAIGGATLGSNALAVTGHLLLEGVTSTGATGSGNLVFATSPALTTPTLGVATATSLTVTTVTGLTLCTASTDACSKAYIDGLSLGIHNIGPSRLATAAVLPNTPTYSNGASGVGATLTRTGNGTLTVDATTANLGDVILVKNQAAAAENGQYYVSAAGSGGAPWVLTRCDATNCGMKFDNAATMLAGSYTFVTAGSTNLNTSYNLSATVTTPGTTAVNFVLFFAGTAGVSSIASQTGAFSCGTGISCAGNAIVNTGILSIASLTGAFTCGTGISCAGNVIVNTGITSIASLTGAFTCGTGIGCSGNTLVSTAQPVDVRVYGAIANDATKGTVNQTAFANAFAANTGVLCPGGTTFYTHQITVPTTAKHFQIDCILAAVDTMSYSAQQAVIFTNNATQGLLIDGSGLIYVDFSVFPQGVNGINIFGASSSVVIKNLVIVGFYGIRIPDVVSNIKVINNFLSYDGTGIQSEKGCNYCLVDGNRFISNRGKDGGNGAYFSSVFPNVQATDITIVNNQCDAVGNLGTGAGGWCYSIQNGANFIIANNVVTNNHIEGITAYGTYGSVRGNVINTVSSADIGISIGPLLNGCICDNVINGALSSGIVLTNGINRFVTVTGNTITPAHPSQAPSLSGGIYTEGWACIALAEQSNDNAIYGNTCLDPFGTDMYWNLLYFGTFQPNFFGPNYGNIGQSGYSGWQLDATVGHAVANFSPAIASCSGSGSPFLVGSDMLGVLVEGTGSTGCTLTFKNITSSRTWNCIVSPQATVGNFAYSLSNANLVITHDSHNNLSVNYQCTQQMQ